MEKMGQLNKHQVCVDSIGSHTSKLCPLHTADADATQLDSCVTSVSAVRIGLYVNRHIRCDYYPPNLRSDAFWDKDKRIRFWVKRSKFKVTVGGIKYAGKALIKLVNTISRKY